MPKYCTYCGREMEDDCEDCPTCHGGKVADPRFRGFVDGTLSLPGVDLVIEVGSEEAEEPPAPEDAQEGREAAGERPES